MFPNCLLLDLTVIELISIVHMDKIWVEIAKQCIMRTSGGRGGSSVISDTPGRGGRGGGGQKRANFCGHPLWMAPYLVRPRCLLVDQSTSFCAAPARHDTCINLVSVIVIIPGPRFSELY